LIKDGANRWNDFCAHVGILPKRIIYLDCTLKAFGNIQREENPEFKEEEFDEDLRNQNNSDLDNFRQIRER